MLRSETPEVSERRLKLELRLAQMSEVDGCHDDFLKYVRKVWPEFIAGAHHHMIAKKFEDIATGRNKRLIINMPPRHTKSEFASYLLPSWIIGRDPKTKIIQTTHTAELAVNFGRKVRNLLASPEYQNIFSGVSLQADSKAAGRWSTNQGGEYFAAGVGGAITGRGASPFARRAGSWASTWRPPPTTTANATATIGSPPTQPAQTAPQASMIDRLSNTGAIAGAKK